MTTSGLRTEARNQFAYFVPYLGLKNVVIADRGDRRRDPVLRRRRRRPAHQDRRRQGVRPRRLFRLPPEERRPAGDRYPDQNAIYDALRKGEVQGIVSPAFNYEYFFKTPEERAAFVAIDVSPAPPVSQNMVFNRRRFSDAEINAWTRVFEAMRLDGTLERICRAQVSPEMTRLLLSY